MILKTMLKLGLVKKLGWALSKFIDTKVYGSKSFQKSTHREFLGMIWVFLGFL